MAYVNQEKKAKIKAALDEALKETGVKYTLAVRHHSTIVCNVRKGPVDFLGNHVLTNSMLPDYNVITRGYIYVNPYHSDKQFSGDVLGIVKKILRALNTDNHDRSDIQTDYFDVGHYVELNIGTWEKPYEINS